MNMYVFKTLTVLFAFVYTFAFFYDFYARMLTNVDKKQFEINKIAKITMEFQTQMFAKES